MSSWAPSLYLSSAWPPKVGWLCLETDPGTSSVARPRKQLWSWRDRRENDRESRTVARPIVSKEHGVDSRSLAWEESVRGNVLSAMISKSHSPVNHMSAIANNYRICVTVYTWHNVAGERAHE